MKTNRAESFFSAEEKERIRREVKAVEAGTAGEIATVVVDSSSDYGEGRALFAMLCAGMLALAVAVAIDHITVWSYIPMVFLFFFPAKYLSDLYPPLKLAFIGRERILDAARGRAIRAFYEKGLYKTRDQTGILIFISLLERNVWILGDRGINMKIPPDSWQSLATELSTGIKEGRSCDALCSVIAKCGEVLKAHFPRKADDTDELTDEVIIG